MKRISTMILFLFAVIFISCVSVSGSEAAGLKNNQINKDITEGWVRIKSETYYLKNGEKQTGWHKIGGKQYYFGKKGILQKNKIVGNKKSGYAYVDSNGICVTDKVIQSAVKFVVENSSCKDSQKKKLKSCYEALCTYHYRRLGSDRPDAEKMRPYASHMFKNKYGDCYRFASAFAYIARVLGYDSRFCFDNTNTMHGWCEIKTDGKWNVCDCTMKIAYKMPDFFLVDKGEYQALVYMKWGVDLKWDYTYTMHVKKGKINWKS